MKKLDNVAEHFLYVSLSKSLVPPVRSATVSSSKVRSLSEVEVTFL